MAGTARSAMPSAGPAVENAVQGSHSFEELQWQASRILDVLRAAVCPPSSVGQHVSLILHDERGRYGVERGATIRLAQSGRRARPVVRIVSAASSRGHSGRDGVRNAARIPVSIRHADRPWCRGASAGRGRSCHAEIVSSLVALNCSGRRVVVTAACMCERSGRCASHSGARPASLPCRCAPGARSGAQRRRRRSLAAWPPRWRG